MSSNRFAALARGALSLVIAGTAFGAVAQDAPPLGQQMYIAFQEGFYATQYGLSDADGASKYFHFDVPAGATAVRVETHAPDGKTNVAFKVTGAAPEYMARCIKGESSNPVQACDFAPQPGRHYVEILGSAAYADIALFVSVLPEIKPVADVIDEPYQLGRRAAYHTIRYDTPHCLESRRTAPGTSAADALVPQATCMPMGTPQYWRFEKAGLGEYAVRNLHSGACLVPESGAVGARVLELACNANAPTGSKHLWRLSAPAGATHYTIIRNANTGLCLDFADGAAAQVPCNEGTAQGPAFDLRDADQRWKPQDLHGSALSVVRGGLCATRDVGFWSVLGDCANPVKSGMNFYPASGTNPWQGAFLIAAGGYDDRCMAQWQSEDGHRYVVFIDCNEEDPTQRWTLEASGADAWEFRNLATGECLNAQYGSGAPGTKLITWACRPAADNARWRWAVH